MYAPNYSLNAQRVMNVITVFNVQILELLGSTSNQPLVGYLSKVTPTSFDMGVVRQVSVGAAKSSPGHALHATGQRLLAI